MIAAIAVIYLAIGICIFAVVAMIAPGGYQNNFRFIKASREDKIFIIGICIFWPFFVTVYILTRFFDLD